MLCFLILQIAARLALADGWFLVGEHYHSSADKEYESAGVAALIEKGVTDGLDAMIITDHNSLYHCYDEKFLNEKRLTLICGEEWTTQKTLHLGIINPQASSPSDAVLPRVPYGRSRDWSDVEEEARNLIAKTRANGNGKTLFVINHPRENSSIVGHYQPSDPLGANAVEVLVPGYESPEQTHQWWLKQISSGFRLVALGGSDYHYCKGSSCVGDTLFRRVYDEAVNLVYAPSAASQDILDHITQGHVIALASNEYKNIRLDLTLKRDGKTYMMGDAVAGVHKGEEVVFSLHVENADGFRLAILGLGNPARVIALEDIKDAKQDLEVHVQKAWLYDAVHVEVVRMDGWKPFKRIAVANPIYF